MKITTSRECGYAEADGPPLSDAPSRVPVRPAALIVDDDPAIQNAVGVILRSIGFTTAMASNGFDALTKMQETPDFSVVLLDLRMPVMDGTETYRELHRRWPTVPVIIVSGHRPHEIGIRLGGTPDGFVQKPFSFSTLTAAVQQTLKSSSARQ